MPTTYTISGLKGPQGAAGSDGANATLTVGNVTSLAAGSTPTVTNSGTDSAAVLNFGIPAGPPGAPGAKGEAGGVLMRHVYASFADWQADTDPVGNHNFSTGEFAFIGGDENAIEYGRLYLYKGNGNGEVGQNSAWQFLADLSIQGIQGIPGANATISLAAQHFTTDDPANITVTNIGTQQDAVLQFTLPRGVAGSTGDTGAAGRGIESLAVNENTITFTFTDATTQDVIVPTGPAGADAVSVVSAGILDSPTEGFYELRFILEDNTFLPVTFPKPAAATISVGSVTGLAAGATPTISNSGDNTDAVFDFGIPAGATGPQGVGISSAAIVEDPANASNWKLTLTLTDASTLSASFAKPADGVDGADGADGAPGAAGQGVVAVRQVDPDTIDFQLADGSYTSTVDLPRGLTGPSATISIGTTTTGAAGTNASVVNTGTPTAASLNFTIPRGETGITGAGFTGGSYDPETGILTFTSDDGIGFSTEDLRGTGSTVVGGTLVTTPNWIIAAQQITGGNSTSVGYYAGSSSGTQRLNVNIPAMQLSIESTVYTLSTGFALDISASESWASNETGYATALNRAGKDFYIYAVKSSSGDTPNFCLSANPTVPDGTVNGVTATEANTRKLGGFHCLCLSVGNIYGHQLTGYLTGDILPRSVWDQHAHRPLSPPEGMVYVEGDLWADIYLASNPAGVLQTVYDAAPIAGGDYGGTPTPYYHWYNFAERFAEINKRLPTQAEFISLALGSNEEVNIDGAIWGGKTTGGHLSYSGYHANYNPNSVPQRRMISDIGCEDCCGALYQWLHDQGGLDSASSTWKVQDTVNIANSYDNLNSIGRGQGNYVPSRPSAGGSWAEGARCGPRGVLWASSPLQLISAVGARGVSAGYSSGTGFAVFTSNDNSPVTLADLTDVDTTTTAPTSGQVLQYNGSEWIPATPAASTESIVYAIALG